MLGDTFDLAGRGERGPLDGLQLLRLAEKRENPSELGLVHEANMGWSSSSPRVIRVDILTASGRALSRRVVGGTILEYGPDHQSSSETSKDECDTLRVLLSLGWSFQPRPLRKARAGLPNAPSVATFPSRTPSARRTRSRRAIPAASRDATTGNSVRITRSRPGSTRRPRRSPGAKRSRCITRAPIR